MKLKLSLAENIINHYLFIDGMAFVFNSGYNCWDKLMGVRKVNEFGFIRLYAKHNFKDINNKNGTALIYNNNRELKKVINYKD